MVRALGPEPDARSIVQPEPRLPRLLLGNLEPFAPPNPLDPLVVHVPARLVQQRRHRPVAVTAILRRQLDDVRRQRVFIGPSARNLPLCRAVLTERATGAALRYAKRLPHAVDALPATRRAQKFPFVCEGNTRDLCYEDPGKAVSAYISTTSHELARVWMGDVSLSDAISNDRITAWATA